MGLLLLHTRIRLVTTPNNCDWIRRISLVQRFFWVCTCGLYLGPCVARMGLGFAWGVLLFWEGDFCIIYTCLLLLTTKGPVSVLPSRIAPSRTLLSSQLALSPGDFLHPLPLPRFGGIIFCFPQQTWPGLWEGMRGVESSVSGGGELSKG